MQLALLSGSVASLRAETPAQHTFASVVERSLSQEVNTQAWCTRCEKYQPHVSVSTHRLGVLAVRSTSPM